LNRINLEVETLNSLNTLNTKQTEENYYTNSNAKKIRKQLQRRYLTNTLTTLKTEESNFNLIFVDLDKIDEELNGIESSFNFSTEINATRSSEKEKPKERDCSWCLIF
jgi:hypothetical protein